MSNQEDINLMHEIRALETSNRWASVAITIIGMLALVAVWWFVDHYYGAEGVRVVGIVLGIALIVVAVIGVGFGVMAIATSLSTRHHNNVLTGLIRFQAADDRGEVVRAVVGGMRSGNALESRILNTANQLARGQTQAMLAASQYDQHQQQVDAEASWYNVAAQFDDSVPKGWGE